MCGVNNAAQGKPNKQTVKQTVEPKSMQRFCFACCSASTLSLFLSSPSLSLAFVCSATAPRFAFKQKPLKTLYYRILELFKYFPLLSLLFLFPPRLPARLTLQLGNYCSFIFSVPSPSSPSTACAPATTTKRLKFSNICAKLWKKMQHNNSLA